MTCCPPEQILVGNQRTLTAIFTQLLTGNLVDPDTVILKVKDPTGTVSTLTPSRQSLGVWIYDYIFSIPGVYVYQFSGTGSVVVVAEQKVNVLSSAL